MKIVYPQKPEPSMTVDLSNLGVKKKTENVKYCNLLVKLFTGCKITGYKYPKDNS